jgi:glyoxylase-like metal-dependent hydrolase (beta-lactamase superfamily II)
MAGLAAICTAAAARGAEPPVESIRVTVAPVRAVPPYVQVEAIAESTWILRAGTANVLAVLTAEGWVVVDTGTRAEAMPLRAEMQRLATRPIVAAFNTHFHDDHAGGNAVYRGMGVPVHASRRTQALEQEIRTRMERGAPREIARLDSSAAAAPAGPDRDRILAFSDFLARWWREGAAEAARDPQFVVPADRPFDGRVRLVVGGLAIEARAFARGAHSDGDAVVAIPARRVVAVGDIVVRGGAPWADQFMGGGSLEGVIAAQDTLAAWLADGFGAAGARADEADSTWRIVPGHGSAMRAGELAADRRALKALRTCARQAFAAGRPRDVAAADCAGAGFPGDTGRYAVWLFDAEWRAALDETLTYKRPRIDTRKARSGR